MNVEFTEYELSLFNNTEILLTKYRILEKVNDLLIETKNEINNFINTSNYILPDNINFKTAKISKGENYKQLPYYVLDYPAHFSNKDIFAFRTMFWWGNFFSSTLHLQGVSLDKHKNNLVNNFDDLLNQDIYICINETPWQYYYEDDNYVLLDDVHKQYITNCNFLKLSKKLGLKNWKKVPSFSKEFLELILSVI